MLFYGTLQIETKPNADGQKHDGRLKTTSTKLKCWGLKKNKYSNIANFLLYDACFVLKKGSMLLGYDMLAARKSEMHWEAFW